MIGTIKIRDNTGLFTRKEQPMLRAALKEAWIDAARYFHDRMRDRRFSIEHAKAAGYAPRKGSDEPIGSKAFWRSYTGRKLKKYGHMRPLEFSGKTRAAMKSYVSLSSTSKGGKAAYPGARAFNYKNPNSDPSMNLNLEFRKILPGEADELAKIIDAKIDDLFNVRVAGWGGFSPEVTTLLESSGMGY